MLLMCQFLVELEDPKLFVGWRQKLFGECARVNDVRAC
jgi:hypothetical protein